MVLGGGNTAKRYPDRIPGHPKAYTLPNAPLERRREDRCREDRCRGDHIREGSRHGGRCSRGSVVRKSSAVVDALVKYDVEPALLVRFGGRVWSLFFCKVLLLECDFFQSKMRVRIIFQVGTLESTTL